MNYEAVIGLEVHAELSTKSKFIALYHRIWRRTNTHCCPVCTGMPGTLPALNRKTVEYAIKAGLATNCTISPLNKTEKTISILTCQRDIRYPSMTYTYVKTDLWKLKQKTKKENSYK